MPIKYISLNVLWGGMLMDNILDFLKKEQPHIIACQEVVDGHDSNLPRESRTIEVFKKQLNYPHHVFAPAFYMKTDLGTINVGNAIFSHFPITSTQTTFFDIPYGLWPGSDRKSFPFVPRNILRAGIRVDSTDVNVFNVHGIWGEKGRDNKRRLNMGDIIAKEISHYKNVILSGDFNIDPDTKTIGKITKHLRSVFRKELKSTFNMKRKEDPGYATAAVDMLFVSENIKVIDHYCPQVDISDHLPLVATFSL